MRQQLALEIFLDQVDQQIGGHLQALFKRVFQPGGKRLQPRRARVKSLARAQFAVAPVIGAQMVTGNIKQLFAEHGGLRFQVRF